MLVSTFACLLSGAPALAVAGFGDVDADRFYAPAVQWMADEGITRGTAPGCFSPERTVTRGEVATFLHRMSDEPPAADHGFSDVKPGDFFADAVAWMAAEGITLGTSRTTFSPWRLVTRGEVATFLHRFDGESEVEIVEGGSCALSGDDNDGGVDDSGGDDNGGDNDGGLDLDPELAAALWEAEEASFALVNELRMSLGRQPLVRVTELDAFARQWSCQMHDLSTLSHSGWSTGENLAWWSSTSATPVEAAERMHQLWSGSGGHYANMVQASYTEVGIGFYQGPDGWYATHIFRD